MQTRKPGATLFVAPAEFGLNLESSNWPEQGESTRTCVPGLQGGRSVIARPPSLIFTRWQLGVRRWPGHGEMLVGQRNERLPLTNHSKRAFRIPPHRTGGKRFFHQEIRLHSTVVSRSRNGEGHGCAIGGKRICSSIDLIQSARGQ